MLWYGKTDIYHFIILTDTRWNEKGHVYWSEKIQKHGIFLPPPPILNYAPDLIGALQLEGLRGDGSHAWASQPFYCTAWLKRRIVLIIRCWWRITGLTWHHFWATLLTCCMVWRLCCSGWYLWSSFSLGWSSCGVGQLATVVCCYCGRSTQGAVGRDVC